ncbi:HipA N-terminal domain-containing protein [Stenotrophomonas sp. ISL-67]|nr:HipA N-terminal domain-containing protein [Stenotrophomonas sp. ISL-67]
MAVRLLDVIYEGWGEQWPAGRLADDGQRLLFEYSSEAMGEGLQLSPQLPLRPGVFEGYCARYFSTSTPAKRCGENTFPANLVALRPARTCLGQELHEPYPSI